MATRGRKEQQDKDKWPVRTYTEVACAKKPLPRLKPWAWILKGGGAGVVVHEVAYALTGVLHLPPWGQSWFLDHPANRKIGLRTGLSCWASVEAGVPRVLLSFCLHPGPAEPLREGLKGGP